MLDISFYDAQGTSAHHIEVAEPFLSWLARTDFSTLGEEQENCILIDGEPENLPLVQLETPIRRRFIDFFNEAIVRETKTVLAQLNHANPETETLYRLQKLIEILDCLKEETYRYLRRI